MDYESSANATQEVGTLLQYALRPRLLPSQHSEYARLVTRYESDPHFQAEVDWVFAGCGLHVVHASLAGFYLAADPDSQFCYHLSDFRHEPNMKDVNSTVHRTIYGLIVLAAVAYFYPTPLRLAEEAYLRVTPTELDAYIRTCCAEIKPPTGEDEAVAERITQPLRLPRKTTCTS